MRNNQEKEIFNKKNLTNKQRNSKKNDRLKGWEEKDEKKTNKQILKKKKFFKIRLKPKLGKRLEVLLKITLLKNRVIFISSV